MHRKLTPTIYSLVMALAVMIASPSFAQIIEFDFVGNGGVGLLPGNEIGADTATELTSTAFGGEVGNGLVFDTETNILEFDFSFEGLSGGLFDANSGIHFHLPGISGDPFNQTGPVVFNLNNFDDTDAVSNTNEQIAFGSTSGQVTGSVLFTDTQAADLLAGEYYLNIHSADFTGGELRGSLTAAVPEPSSLTVIALLTTGMVVRRRRTR